MQGNATAWWGRRSHDNGMAAQFDIVGIGCVAVDDLLYVDVFPPEDVKCQIRRSERQCGGLTGTALVAAAKLGGKCAFAGSLGFDDLSRVVEENFVSQGIDVSGVVRLPEVKPIHAAIVVAEDRHTRNIFFDASAPIGAPPSGPDPGLIHKSRVLFIDDYGLAGNIKAAEIARSSGVPVVADFERDDAPAFAALQERVDHLVLSEGFARRITGAPTAASAVGALWNESRAAVVVTCGAEGAWYRGSRDVKPEHSPAFRVKVVDTTGCGDVFHGAYALALARGKDIEFRVRFASAAAALKAGRPGGQTGAPTADEVAALLQEE